MTFVSYNISPLKKVIPISTIRSNYPLMIDTFVPINGIELGIPLNIFTNIYTNLHYGYDITDYGFVLMQFLIGYYTYGKDRLADAIEFKKEKKVEGENSGKLELYESLYSNREKIKNLHITSLLGIIVYLCQDIHTIPIIPLLYINGEYKYFKSYLQEYKAVYISIMWAISTIILPCILHDHNYDILKYPGDYLPCMLTLFATSNYADTLDIEEDRINKINTIPVKYGLQNSNLISFAAIIVSAILLIENKHFENRPLINSLVEIQNFATMGSLYNSSFLSDLL